MPNKEVDYKTSKVQILDQKEGIFQELIAKTSTNLSKPIISLSLLKIIFFSTQNKLLNVLDTDIEIISFA